MSRASEDTVRFEPASLGSEGLVEVRDNELHSCRDFSGDLGEVHRQVQRRVCSPGGEGTLQANVQKREIELETQAREEAESQRMDRRPAQSQPAAKRTKSADSRTGGQKGHEGAYRSGACYKCGKEGHIAKDFPKGFMVCFHCNQTGHRKAECPQLHQGSAQGSTPAARVTKVRPMKDEAPKARGRAFQLTAEEVRAAPDVVAVYATDVIRGCILEIFGVEFLIELIPIAIGDVYVIVGMDWLSRFGAVIDCERQLVTIRNPSGGVLTVYGEGTRCGSAFCSAARARQSLQQGCSGFVAYVLDTRMAVGRPISIDEVPIVCEFPDVFPEELPGVPPYSLCIRESTVTVSNKHCFELLKNAGTSSVTEELHEDPNRHHASNVGDSDKFAHRSKYIISLILYVYLKFDLMQLVGLTSLLLASKYEDFWHPQETTILHRQSHNDSTTGKVIELDPKKTLNMRRVVTKHTIGKELLYSFILFTNTMLEQGISHKESVNPSNIMPFVKEALDGIEFARGDPNSTWGCVRAAMGHPKPFDLKYVAIGNEDCWLKKYHAYPDIKMIFNCDGSNGPLDHPVDMYDFHIYANASTVFSMANTFDHTSPFVSEYAMTGNDAGSGSLLGVLVEAGFLIGIVICNDVVEMANYAPLFVNTNDRRWMSDAIVFDSSQSYGTPSYWMQHFFKESNGATLLKSTL
uniref:non-reducing end alpha-L-arabinofuranosidase n=1 Tax=Lactuca sativa TaxID=4236 RepID=A0A9R1WVR4_LACSA|nr:hypothetical protein LSAT_V11C900476550 [Lactuca sativa]